MSDDDGDDDREQFRDFAGSIKDDASRRAHAKTLSDHELLYFYTTLSNPKVIASSSWIPMLEAEIKKRKLRPPN
jgi:hypothetical protein